MAVHLSTTTAFVDDHGNRNRVTSPVCISAIVFHLLPIVTFEKALHLCNFSDNEIDEGILFSRTQI